LIVVVVTGTVVVVVLVVLVVLVVVELVVVVGTVCSLLSVANSTDMIRTIADPMYKMFFKINLLSGGD